jgi:sulfate adenylyltransferase
VITETENSLLISPCGGALKNLLVPADELAELRAYANTLPPVRLSERAACDLEMLATGAFSPLAGFMGAADYRRVLEEMRLADGHVFPVPVTLPVGRDAGVREGQEIALCDAKNEALAVMRVEEVYEWDKTEAAQKVYGTRDLRHPLVAEIQRRGELNVAGSLRVLRLPRHHDFKSLRLTPAETRARLSALGRPNVVAFQTRNPLHRVHEEMTRRAAAAHDGVLLLHPAVGMTKPGDVDHYSRVRTYKILAERYYEPGRVLLALLPLAMRMAGPREALWHAVIRRNYGANFLIVGRDHASPGADADGRPFYPPYAAQELVARYSAELGVGVVPFEELVYLPDEERYEERSKVVAGARTLSISGTQVREDYLAKGRKLPAWFTRAEVEEILAETYPPRLRQGVCVWLTGLSCAGKSTIAEVLTEMLLARGRRVTLLDGDVVRAHLSAGLGFGKEDRDANVRRIGFVASEIARHGGVAVCAAISPYRAARNDVRAMVGGDQFVEVFVDAPLDVCERRDTKGLYAKARRGELKHFTGVDDPYEPPQHAELTLDAAARAPEESARLVVDFLAARGFVAATFD